MWAINILIASLEMDCSKSADSVNSVDGKETLFKKHLVADKKSSTSVLDIRCNFCNYGNQRLDIWINVRRQNKKI